MGSERFSANRARQWNRPLSGAVPLTRVLWFGILMVSCSVRFPAIRGQWRIAVFVFPWRRFGVGGDSLLRKGPTPVYAIIESGGKQFRVEENQYLQLGK